MQNVYQSARAIEEPPEMSQLRVGCRSFATYSLQRLLKTPKESAESAGALEYADCISADELPLTHPQYVSWIWNQTTWL